jgi:hypothetical protein
MFTFGMTWDISYPAAIPRVEFPKVDTQFAVHQTIHTTRQRQALQVQDASNVEHPRHLYLLSKEGIVYLLND